MRFRFTVDLTTMLPHDETTVKPVETMTGTIEAEDYARAKQKAYVPIVERKQQIEREQGIMVGVGNIQLALSKEPLTLTLCEYMLARQDGKQLDATDRIILTVGDMTKYELALYQHIFEDLRVAMDKLWRQKA